MDGDDRLDTFADWLRDLATQAGYDPDTRGGIAALARDSGTDRGQTSRALRGEVRPQIASLRAWTRVFIEAGVAVTLREMLIRSGTLQPDDLPGPDDPPPPPAAELDLYAVARAYGIPDDRAPLFVASIEAVANTFAGEPEGSTIKQSQTGRLSARR